MWVGSTWGTMYVGTQRRGNQCVGGLNMWGDYVCRWTQRGGLDVGDSTCGWDTMCGVTHRGGTQCVWGHINHFQCLYLWTSLTFNAPTPVNTTRQVMIRDLRISSIIIKVSTRLSHSLRHQLYATVLSCGVVCVHICVYSHTENVRQLEI